MKKLKILMLLILWLMLIIQTSLAESQQQLSLPLENEYGLDLEKTYKATEILEIINIILEESDTAIETAFNEGYKQGLLFSAPDVEYWKEKANQYEKRNKTEKIIAIISSFGVGFLTGGASGFYVGIKF